MSSRDANQPAPIALFVYCRLEHTRQTIESLQKNTMAMVSDLHIFSDGPRAREGDAEKVEAVRTYVRQIGGFRSVHIIERPSNIGLANSVIAGVTELLRAHGKVIVVEDDMVSSRNFLAYMNRALDAYRDHPRIYSVSGYSFPITLPPSYRHDLYLGRRSSSWGWGTWVDKWAKVDWKLADYSRFLSNPKMQSDFNIGGDDLTGMLRMQMEGKIDSWSIRFDYAHYKFNAYCLYPRLSKIHNIGFDGSGVHCQPTTEWDVKLDPNESVTEAFPPRLGPSRKIQAAFDRLFRPQLANQTFSARAFRAAKRLRSLMGGVRRRFLAHLPRSGR